MLSAVAFGSPQQQEKARHRLLANHPDLDNIEGHLRGRMLGQKIREDAIVQLPFSIVYSVILSSVLCMVPSMLGTTFADRVLREETRRRAIVLYAELMLTLTLLVIAIFLAVLWTSGAIPWIQFRWVQFPFFAAIAFAVVARLQPMELATSVTVVHRLVEPLDLERVVFPSEQQRVVVMNKTVLMTAIAVLATLSQLPAQQSLLSFEPPSDVSFRTAKIMSEGTRMAAELFSTKDAKAKLPTILMSHGWGGTAEALRPDGVAFAQAGFFVVTFDYRGWGNSGCEADCYQAPLYPKTDGS